MYEKMSKIINSNIFLYLAFLWWFLEATFFFIIPDVLISFLWVFLFKRKFKLIIFTVLWAVLWWLVTYSLWKYSILEIYDLSYIYLINDTMISKVLSDVKDWYLWIIISTIKWIPYKIQAITYWSLNIDVILFIFLSILARLPRFVITLFISLLIWKYFKKYIKKYIKTFILIFILFWLAIYYSYYNIITSIYY